MAVQRTCTPPPLHRQTVTRKTASQAPLKSALGWPAVLYRRTLGPRNENSYRFYGAPGQPSINNSGNSCIFIIVKLIGYGRK